MKVLCDQMLGTLAKWLRICGFDTLYDHEDVTDDDLLKQAELENRLIISRDKELIFRGKRRNLSVLELYTTDIDEQLQQVLKKITLDEKNILTRCTLCNSMLLPIVKEKVEGKVPQNVFESNQQFWYCSTCQKYYWMGTHYQHMLKKIKHLIKES